MTERIQKLLAAAGLCSRRTAEEWIAAGRVTVNGRRVRVGDKADPETDDIRVDGRPLRGAAQHVYLMLHKPRGYVTTLSDERGRPTAASLVRGLRHAGVSRGTAGPGLGGITAVYQRRGADPCAAAPQPPGGQDVYRHGHWRGRGQRTAAVGGGQTGRTAHRAGAVDELYRRGDRAEYRIVIHQGKKRQIRRMCRRGTDCDPAVPGGGGQYRPG